MLEKLHQLLVEAPNAVSGSDGHKTTFAVACLCWRYCENFDGVHEAMTWYNKNRCVPAWSEKEIRHKIVSARKAVGADVGIYAPKHFSPTTRPAFAKKSDTNRPVECHQTAQDWLFLPLWVKNEYLLITKEKAPQKPSCSVLRQIKPSDAMQSEQLRQIIAIYTEDKQDWGKLPKALQKYLLTHIERPAVPSVALLVSVPLPPEPLRDQWRYAVAACAIRDALGGAAAAWWGWAKGQQPPPPLPTCWNVQLPDLRQSQPVPVFAATLTTRQTGTPTLFAERAGALCVVE